MTTLTEEKDDVKKRLRKGGRGITLKYDGNCADCGAFLAKGTTARWYGRGRIYGYTCHSNPGAGSKPAPKVGILGSEPVQDDLWAGAAASADQEPAAETPRDSKGEFKPRNYDCTIR